MTKKVIYDLKKLNRWVRFPIVVLLIAFVILAMIIFSFYCGVKDANSIKRIIPETFKHMWGEFKDLPDFFWFAWQKY
jgi:hypothetical protein